MMINPMISHMAHRDIHCMACDAGRSEEVQRLAAGLLRPVCHGRLRTCCPHRPDQTALHLSPRVWGEIMGLIIISTA
jgi:hypothetical protein